MNLHLSKLEAYVYLKHLQKPLDTPKDGDNTHCINEWRTGWSQNTNSEAMKDDFKTRMEVPSEKEKDRKSLALWGKRVLSELHTILL